MVGTPATSAGPPYIRICVGWPRTRCGGAHQCVREPANKPGSVVDSHLSGMPVARHLKQPTRA